MRTCLGSERGAKELKTRFLSVEASTPYNVLIDRHCLNAFGAIVSTPYLTLKFPSDMGPFALFRQIKRSLRNAIWRG